MWCRDLRSEGKKNRQMFILTGVTNILFDPDVSGPSGRFVLTKALLLADAAPSELQTKCSKGVEWEIGKSAFEQKEA